MKRLVLLSLLLFPIFLFAQYPTFSNKQKLGVQTTGDGLIYRGNEQTPSYTPNNVNNAYFYLDTVRNTLKFYKTNQWFTIYPTSSDTISLGAYLLKSDTLAMLLPYLRKSDTISLSNRINNKLNATDTVSLSNRINLKLNKTDTINLSNRIDLKLNKSDTVSLSNRINIKLNPSDTVSLSNRINTKLNTSDTISLSNRINKKLDTLYVNYQTNVDLLTNKDTININTLEAGAGINIVNNVISLDTTLLDSVVRVQNVYVKNGTGTVLNKGEAVYVTGAAGTNILVGRASNVSESSSSKTLGLTMTSIGVNGFGYVIKEGLLKGLNTNSATAGDPIWLGENGGLLFGLANKPFAPKHLVYLGVVTDKNPSVGEVYVTVQNGFEIKELHDVQITSPSDKASLYYKSSEGLWRDTTPTILVSDTTSMLSKYVNTYGNQTNINGDKTFNNVITIDSATVTGKLLVNTNISNAVKITSNTNSTNLELANNSGSSVSIKSSNKNMILQTDTTSLVYLNGDNKKVGILTMTPQQELEVAGNVRIDSLNNNLTPFRLIGSTNNNDLTNVNLGEGLSFSNDTLKVDLTIIDTAIAASSITLAGHVTGTGSTNSTVTTIINNGVVTNDMLAGSISDSKLNTITTSGKISNTAFASQTANTVLAAPNGSNGTPTFRLLASTDIPNLNYLPLTGGTLTGGLNGTTGTFNTRLGVGSIEALSVPTLFSSGSGDQEIHFTHSDNVPGRKVSLRLTNNNSGFYTYGGLIYALEGQGLNEYARMSLGINTTEIMHLTRFSRVGIMNNSPSYTLDVNGTFNATGNSLIGGTLGVTSNITANSFIKSLGTSLQFLKADGSVDANTYLTTGTAASTYQNKLNGTGFVKASGLNITYDNTSYLPLTGGTLTGTLNGINQNLNNNLTITDPIPGNDPRIYTVINSDSATTVPVRLTLDQAISGGANMFMGGSQVINGNPTNPTIYFGDSRKAYASISGIYTGAALSIPSGYISFSTTPAFNTTPSTPRTPLTERMRISQDGSITMGGTLGVTGATTINNVLTINSGASNGLLLNGTNSQFIKVYSSNSSFGNAGTWYQNATTGQTEGSDGLFVGIVGGTGSYFTNYENSRTYFRTSSNSNQLVLDTDGNVGIGIEDATAKLDVSGTLKVLGTTTLSNLGTNGTRMVVTDNNGLLSTQAIPSSGSGTVTNVSAGSPANGLSVANPTTTPIISMALAGNGTTGVVSATTQEFSGAKTFNDNVIISATSTLTVGSTGTFGGRLKTTALERTYVNSTATTMTVNPNITWLNIHQDATVTLTLPNAATYLGKELIIKQTGTGIVLSSGDANIIGFTTRYDIGTPQNVIINPSTYRFATLVSDGTYWIIMQRNN